MTFKRLLVISMLTLLAGCSETPQVSGAQLETAALAPSVFTSTLQASHSGKCLDVPRGTRRTGARLIQWRCNGGKNQPFSFHPVADNYAVRSEVSGLCLELTRRADDRYTYLTQERCDKSHQQQFRLKASGGTFALVNRSTGSCVDVRSASRANRAELIGYRCHGEANQQWQLPGYAGAQPGPTDRTKVVAVGDIACTPGDSAFNGGSGTAERCRMLATARLAESLNPEAVLVLGDLQYNRGEYNKFLASYEPSWGRLKRKTYPVPGNHEYDSPGAAGYYRYFGARAGDPTKGYYSFDLGNWHVVALNTNSNCTTISCAEGSAQERWLRADLAANRKKCVVATMHHPRYSSGRHGGYSSVRHLWKTLHDGGADLVLSGHDHHYERLAPLDGLGRKASGGTRSFIVGTGGKSLYVTDRQAISSSERYITNRYGVLELGLGNGDYTWSFIAEGGERLDAGSAACN